MSEIDRQALKYKILQEQRAWQYAPAYVAYCVWCGRAGGHKNFEPMDLHEWLLKRGANAPDEITFSPINVILAHHSCHQDHGQTRTFKEKCYLLKKAQGYDPEGWIEELLRQGHIAHRPDIYSWLVARKEEL